MLDASYVRGWDDCLEAISSILSKVKNVGEMKQKIDKLRELIKDDKFERIRYELGAFDIF